MVGKTRHPYKITKKLGGIVTVLILTFRVGMGISAQGRLKQRINEGGCGTSPQHDEQSEQQQDNNYRSKPPLLVIEQEVNKLSNKSSLRLCRLSRKVIPVRFLSHGR